jgi:FtsP/CotA-like multicopper oxidase with cupredoxin domain
VPVFTHKDKEAVGTGTMMFSILAAVLAFAALLTAAHANSKSGGGGGAPAGASQVQLSEFQISPSRISAPVGGKIVVTNNGSATHNFWIGNTSLHTRDLKPGDSVTVDLKGVAKGSYPVYCNVPGHKEAGMNGTLIVGGSGAASSAAAGMGNMDFNSLTPEQLQAMNDQMDQAMKAPVDSYVAQLTKGANTKGVGNQPLQPTILPDGTKQFNLDAKLADWEVQAGQPPVRAWTFNGTVPGPWIHVNVGDKVKVVVKNDLPMSTGVHFHGLEVPFEQDGVPDVTQQPIKPGTTYTYSFTPKEPQMAMYHSHHDAQVQVPNGMLGIFQVGDMPLPPNAGPVTQEVPMVLNDAGVVGLSLNGKSFPSTAPIIAHPGDWVEINYFNEGLQIHPMHLHGIPQLVIAKDGYPTPAPYKVDTLLIAPGERYTVLVHPTTDHLGAPDPKTGKPTMGIWAFHCHILTHAESPNGMFGMVTTFIVEP